MRKNYLVNPKGNISTYSVADFKNVTDLALGVSIGNEIKGCSAIEKIDVLLHSIASKLYCLGDRLLVYFVDGSLYELIDGQKVLLLKGISMAPTILQIVYKGKDSLLILKERGSVIVSEYGDIAVNIPYGKFALVHKGRLFVATDYAVYFGNQYNFNDCSVDTASSGFISVDRQFGEIVGMTTDESGITVFCSRAIYKLQIIDGVDFLWNKLDVLVCDIKTGSIKTMGDKILFVDENALCALKDKSIEKICDFNYQVSGEAGLYGKRYFIPVKKDRDNKFYLLICDIDGGKTCMLQSPSNITCDGGWIADNDNSQLCKLSCDNVEGVRSWKSNKLYLGCRIKSRY